MLTAGDIMAAINDALDNKQKPEEIEVGQVIPESRVPIAPGQSVPFQNSLYPDDGAGPGIEDLNAFFAHHDARYVIETINDTAASIRTASDAFAASLGRSVTICICEGDPKHSFEPAQLRKPGICNKPHAKRVTCSEASDT
jgi:hypothetical protein